MLVQPDTVVLYTEPQWQAYKEVIKKLKTPRAKTRKTKKTIVVTERPEIQVQRAVVYLNYCQ